MTEHHRSPEWARVTRVMRPRIKATLPAPCVDCGHPVDPEGAWQIGHIVSVAQGKQMGWTTQQINDPTNLGPSHSNKSGPQGRSCNQSAGGRLGAQVSNIKKKTDRRLLPW